MMDADGDRVAENHTVRSRKRADRAPRGGPHRRGRGRASRHQPTLRDKHRAQPDGPARRGEPLPAGPGARLPAQGPCAGRAARPDDRRTGRRQCGGTAGDAAMTIAVPAPAPATRPVRPAPALAIGAALPSLVRWGTSADADLVYRTLVTFGARTGRD